jgi:hypothetical protein
VAAELRILTQSLSLLCIFYSLFFAVLRVHSELLVSPPCIAGPYGAFGVALHWTDFLSPCNLGAFVAFDVALHCVILLRPGTPGLNGAPHSCSF